MQIEKAPMDDKQLLEEVNDDNNNNSIIVDNPEGLYETISGISMTPR